MSNRLTRFRDYMARFDAAAKPEHAIERGFYVERTGRSVADEIAGRIELRQSTTHLLVGGVGSGKTTQLLMASKRLGNLQETMSTYIDVSLRHDITHMKPGVLCVLAGLYFARNANLLALYEQAQEDILLEFERRAGGYVEYESKESDSDEAISDRINIPGVLSRPHALPTSAEFPELHLLAHSLSELAEMMRLSGRHAVVLFDSLDRIDDVATFEQIVENDVAALRCAGIGVVLVGPLRTLYGADRTIFDRFDYYYHQPAIGDTGADFLIGVLRARADADILPDAPCRRLATYSGGVLRDLITLAQAAGEEAYLAGADQITVDHVETAADAFGRKHLLGLGPDELEVLQRVRTKGIFVQTSDKDLALLVTRRVLEYQNGRPRYAVHPTIRPLLEQLAETP